MKCVHALIVALTLAGSAALAVDAPEPMSINQYLYEQHKNDPTHPSLLADPGPLAAPMQASPAADRLSATIFGYLPYWESADNLRYDLLTHVACFSVGVNSNGTLTNPHSWPWPSVINTAHANGVKVILVVTQFDTATLLTLVTNPTYKNAFFVNIKNMMLLGTTDGINIDFEGSGTYRSYINGFMAELTAYMHAQVPGSEVTFAGPAVNWSNGWDLPGLAASCDGIFIMGYAFSGSWSTYAGPTAPLTGGSINITNTVMTQYAQVTQNNPEKLILGVPYYGSHFKVVSDQPRAAMTSFVSSPRFSSAHPEAQAYGRLWDTQSQTPWYRYYDGSSWHQIWYDDDVSLGLKYDLAQSANLQGVGMWALGYDGARTELWDELERQFTIPPVPRRSDFDDDTDVDQADFGFLQSCFTTPEEGPVTGVCENADLDRDTDVDPDDLAIFIACISGPILPAAPECTN